MSDAIKFSIDEFIKNLKSTITIYETAVSTNNAGYITLKEVFGKKVSEELNIDDITLEQVMSISRSELDSITNVVCTSSLEITKIMDEFDTVRNADNQEIKYFFNNIMRLIKNYLIEYNKRINEEKKYKETKISECNFYINLFEKKEFDRFTTPLELNKLKECFKSIGMLPEDILNLVDFINQKNMDLQDKLNIPVDINTKVNELVSKYMNDDNKEMISSAKLMLSKEFDLELLPSHIYRVCSECGYDYSTFNNIVITLLINSYYKEYIETNDDSYLNNINDLFKQILYKDKLLNDSKKIILNNIDILEMNPKKANNYLDYTVEEIMNICEIDEERAKKYKTSSLVIRINNTYKHLISLNEDEDCVEYREVRDMLEQLVLRYNSYYDMLEEHKKRI